MKQRLVIYGRGEPRRIEVEYVRIEDEDSRPVAAERSYRVIVDGVHAGFVDGVRPTRERSAGKGKRYVAARWTSKTIEWRWREPGDEWRGSRTTTIKRIDAVARLLGGIWAEISRPPEDAQARGPRHLDVKGSGRKGQTGGPRVCAKEES